MAYSADKDLHTIDILFWTVFQYYSALLCKHTWTQLWDTGMPVCVRGRQNARMHTYKNVGWIYNWIQVARATFWSSHVLSLHHKANLMSQHIRQLVICCFSLTSNLLKSYYSEFFHCSVSNLLVKQLYHALKYRQVLHHLVSNVSVIVIHLIWLWVVMDKIF